MKTLREIGQVTTQGRNDVKVDIRRDRRKPQGGLDRRPRLLHRQRSWLASSRWRHPIPRVGPRSGFGYTFTVSRRRDYRAAESIIGKSNVSHDQNVGYAASALRLLLDALDPAPNIIFCHWLQSHLTISRIMKPSHPEFLSKQRAGLRGTTTRKHIYI